MSNKAKEITSLYSEIDAKLITSTELEDNERSQGQKIAYPRYEHPTLGKDQPLVIQFPWIKISSYGIPRAGQYYKNDSDRTFIKLPLDPMMAESKELINIIKSIDERFSSEEFASNLLGPKWKKYTYTPIYRESIDNDDDDETKSKGAAKPKLPYMKLKIGTDYNSGAINTILFKSEMVDGKRKRTQVNDIESIDKFASVVSYLSNFRPIARIVKFWAQPLTKKDPAWGATFKIIKAEVESNSKGSSVMKDFMNSDAFLESDEETPAKVKESTSKETTSKEVVTKEVKKIAQIESDEDEDDEDEKPVAKTVKKIVESDDEDEDVKVKQPVKQTKKVESDDDSEDEKPAPKTTKPAAKSTRGGKGGKTVNA